MKKLLALAVMITLVVMVGGWLSKQNDPANLAATPHDLIRFHVLANSDSKADQQLKLKVRDAILAKFSPVLAQSTSLAESRKLIKGNLAAMQQEAARVLKANGSTYPVKVVYGNFDFPVKSYGDLTLPAGNYEAVRILIGKAEGANWWCVLYPPLCFVDITTSLTANPAVPETATDTKPVIKFKTVEVIEHLVGK